jgi:MoaA/NifB/PqqE/SkfB family radical SAM enzyme
MLLQPINFHPSKQQGPSPRTQTEQDTALNLSGIGLVVIYMGDTCNFDCVYCDREYIKQDIGSQNLRSNDLDQLDKFFETLENTPNEIKYVSFHGGEPMLYLKKIDQILDRIHTRIERMGARAAMTTNGSMIKENEWFFAKWGYNFTITLSYDFRFQELNRESIDLEAVADISQKYNCQNMFQFVVPTDQPDAYDANTVASVINGCKLLRSNAVNIIPLRHHRGLRKFKVLIDDINLNWFSINFMRFIQALYVHGINVYIDGNYDKVDKAYLNNHSKLILSPDGYIYPEFDFLEYKRTEFRTGVWKDDIRLYRQGNEDPHILDKCKTCEQRQNCGLKYLYKMFDQEPKGACVDFYATIDLMVKHLYKLKQKTSLLHWVGYDDK